MAYDFKKEQKEFYRPTTKPMMVEIPSMNFLAVRGTGDPNEENGEYAKSIQLLYSLAYTLRMSYKGTYKIEGFFEYVVPPLDGFWWQEGVEGVDYARKNDFKFVSLIRLPDFIKKADFDWAIEEATRKKGLDYSIVEFFTYDEGLCVQCMHVGPYDNEPETVLAMENFAKENGYVIDIGDKRFHHEIYLSDPRKIDPAKLKTVVRHPVKKIEA